MGDEDLRDLERRVRAGDVSPETILELASHYEAAYGARGKVPARLVKAVVQAFERIERHCDQFGIADPLEVARVAERRDPQFDWLHGVADALGVSLDELWAVSERRRKGAGAERTARLRARAEAGRSRFARRRARGFKIDVTDLRETEVEFEGGAFQLDDDGTIRALDDDGDTVDVRRPVEPNWTEWAAHFGVLRSDFTGPDSDDCDDHCEDHGPACDELCRHSFDHVNECLSPARQGMIRARRRERDRPRAEEHPRYSYRELRRRPTIGTSQDADLKIDDGDWRVWLTRGERTVLVERLEDGRWQAHERYEAE